MKPRRRHQKSAQSSMNKSNNQSVHKSEEKQDENMSSNQPLHSDGEEDVESSIEDEDLEYFDSVTPDNLSFLLNLETSESEPSKKPGESSKRSRKRKLQQEEMEGDFEQKPRSGFTEGPVKKMKPLLPIKNKKGLELQWVEKEESKEEETEKEEMETVEKETEKKMGKPLPPVSTVELFARRQWKLQEKKQQIASLASAIVEDPENSVKKLKGLRMMLDENDPDVLITVRKLVMVSLLEIFKDIAPGYTVREMGESEKTQMLSKDVQKVRDFEESLIKNYRLYLEKLERAIKGYKRREKVKKNGQVKEQLPTQAIHSLREVAARCMCNLMISLSHFNYRSNIISLIVPLVTDKDKQISDMCCNAVTQLFKEDPLGEASLDAVKVITRIVKARNFNVKRKVLDTFLSLKIKDIDLNADESEDAKKKFMTHKEKMKRLSRKERKRSKRSEKLEKELLEAASTESKKKKQHLQTEIIKMVFAIYFRILKKADTPSLLPSVLEGLAKYAHLINVEFFDDLVKVLHSLIESGELSNREILHCILTVFKLLSGQGKALNIDPLKFYSHLYKILFELHEDGSSKDIPVALKCLDVMINKRRKQVTIQRVLAFTKKLCSLSLHVPPNAALGIMATVRSFLMMYTKCEVLLDNDTTGSGVYLPELQEPEHCSAHNTALWELYLLRKHYHPLVRQYSSHLCQGASSQTTASGRLDLTRKPPLELLSEYDASDMTFNPSIQQPMAGKKTKVMVFEKPFLQRQIQDEVDKATGEMADELTTIDFCKSVPNLKLPKTLKKKSARPLRQTPKISKAKTKKSLKSRQKSN